MHNLVDQPGWLPHGVSVRRMQLEEDDHAQTNVEVRTRAGLELHILTDRALDIGPAFLDGMPVSWTSGAPFRHPLDLRENVWGERFAGGLVATCGLDNVGPACIDHDASFAQHGTLSGEPAREVGVGVRTMQGRRFLLVHGRIRPNGSELQLHRAIIISDDAPLLRLVDTVVNAGESSEPVMIQYHVNFGRPILAPGGTVEIPGARTVPRDAAAADRLDVWRLVEAPIPREQERVFRHEQEDPMWARACVRSTPPGAEAGLVACVRYDRRQLPWLWQWRLLSTDDYVIGLEPSNCAVKPRSAARQQRMLPMLGPKQRVTFRTQIEFGEVQEPAPTGTRA